MDPIEFSMDPVYFWLLVLVALMAFIDFYIGKEGQERWRDRATKLWFHVDEYSYAGLAIEDARRLRHWLVRIFGPSRLGLRGFLVSALVSTVLLFVFSLVAYLWHFGLNLSLPVRATAFIWVLLPNALLDWTSIRFTIWALSKIAPADQKPSWKRFAVWSAIDLLLAGCVLAIAVVCVVSIVDLASSRSEALLLQETPSVPPESVEELEELFEHAVEATNFSLTTWFTETVFAYAAGASVLVPSLALAATFLAFLLTKLVRPLLQRPTATVLARIAESDRGVLTLVAIALASLAGLLRWGWKAYGG